MNTNQQLEVAATEPKAIERAPERQQVIPHPATILQSVLERGITPDSAAVAEKILNMCREEKRDDARRQFAQAFFNLRKEMPIVYADKQVTTKSGAVAFEYCSPQEIKDTLEPLMMRHGFFTMSGQEYTEDGKITVKVTLIHQAGHEETRSFTIRVSPGNQLMSPTQCDAAASTSAERHALIKLFGLRTRLSSDDDPRLVGEHITAQQAEELERRVAETNSDRARFLAFAGATKFSEIMSSKYAVLDAELAKREKAGR